MDKKILWITRTAILLAICLAFQSLRLVFPSIPTLVVGSLVNLVLFITVATVGLTSGIMIAVITPVVAILQSFLPFPQMILVVAAGNIVLVFVFYLFAKKENHLSMIAGVIASSLIKFLLLWGLVKLLIIPLLINFVPEKKVGPVTNALTLNFSWPQLITALVGGVVALAVIPAVKKSMKTNRKN